MTVLPSSLGGNVLTIPSICLNFTSHRAYNAIQTRFKNWLQQMLRWIKRFKNWVKAAVTCLKQEDKGIK